MRKKIKIEEKITEINKELHQNKIVFAKTVKKNEEDSILMIKM